MTSAEHEHSRDIADPDSDHSPESVAVGSAMKDPTDTDHPTGAAQAEETQRRSRPASRRGGRGASAGE